jgi:hypothetical protein
MKIKTSDTGFQFQPEEGGFPFALTLCHKGKEYLVRVKDAEEIPDELSDEELFAKVAKKELEWTK